MANSYLFDTTYSASEFDASGTGARNSYRIIIGDKQGSQSSTAATEMELLDPGMNLSWQGDDTMSKTIMGGSLSFTALLNDAQLATVELLMSGTNEGDVFCLFFNSTSSAAKPYWYGHLLMESVSIQVMNEKHVVDMQFTDGLGSLRGAKWEDSPGVLYTGFKKLSFYVREIVSKLPAYAAFREYVQTELSESAVPVTREIAWPDPTTPAGFTYDEQDHKLDNFKVRAETFNKPKKQQNRFRETEAPFDYFTAADVLDDICTTFGATACIFGGYLNLGCRLDIATLKGNFVYDARYDYTSASDSWTITGQYDAWDNLDADDQYNVLSGASKGYTMPIAQVYLTHEEGGSDDLYADGWFINPDISYVNHDQADSSFGAVAHRPSVFSGSAINSSSTLFNGRADLPRRDKLYDFLPPLGGPISVDLGFYLYPASPTAYLGFPSKTVNDLEYQSGEEVRLTFGGSAKFFARKALNLGSADLLKKIHIGAHLIIRIRIQFTTEDGVGYRLSRPVETHAISDGSPDFIRIDDVQSYYDTTTDSIVKIDKYYFRKLYKEMVWLKDDASNYDDDGWFEIMVPHGDNENNGEGYGSTLYPLTQQYGGQVGYAPIGTKIKGEDDGAGVILEESQDDQTLLQYFREDITFSLPYANEAQTAVLDFEDFYFEMGAQEYEPQTGPREASGASASGTWEGDIPLWKSAEAGGTGSVRYPGSGYHFAQPDYLHFTGMRIAVGDGSESSDLTTKVLGGDGYEIINLGSSRLGSRTGFLNNHATGTVFAREKTGDAEGQFPSGTGRLQDDYKERLQWKGHRHGEGSIADDGTFDSIHRYYGEAYINLFGKAREVYSMTLVASPNSPAYRTLKNPFEVMKMNTFQTDKGIDEYLMPLKYSWTLNNGVSGEFIKVGQVRDITTITSDEGRPIRGGGAVVGLGTGVDVIQQALESKFVTDAITVDDDTGDVTVIAVKSGSTVFDADKVAQGSTNKFVTAAQLTALAGFTNDEAVYVKWDSANNFFEDGNDAFVSHRFTSAEQTKVGHLTVSAAVDLDVTAGQALRYGVFDDDAADNIRNGVYPNWINALSLSVLTKVEKFFITTPHGTGDAEDELTTSVPSGFQRERTIFYSYRGTTEVENINKSWAKLSTIWSGASLNPGDSFATAKSKLEDFLTKEVTNAQIRFSFVIIAQDVDPVNYLLSTYTDGCQAAYSLRKLKSDATAAIRIRNSSGTEADIGWVGEDLDTDAIASYAGAGISVDVIKLYDQSGQGRHLTPPATSNRPTISSTMQVNGKPAMLFDGSDDYLKTSSNFGPNPNDQMYLAWVGQFSTSAGAYAMNSWSTTANDQNFQLIKLANDTLRLQTKYDNAQISRFVSSSSIAGNQYIVTARYDNDASCELDGVALTDVYSQSSSAHANNSNNAFALGARATDGGAPMSGYIQEAVIWSTSTNYTVADLTDSIETYYDSIA